MKEIRKITIEKQVEANGRFINEWWEIIVKYEDGTHDIVPVYEIEEVLKFIREHKK